MSNVYVATVIGDDRYIRILEIACRIHNRLIELEEIIEMFCLDAEEMQWAAAEIGRRMK